MIQFNMLPQVKIDYIKTKRLKRAVIAGSVAFAGLSIAIVLVTLSLSAVQKRHLSNLDKDIKKLTAELESIPDLSKMLSVQNQLNTLPTLYAGRPAVKRLPGYLDQTTPSGTIGLNRVTVDFSTSKLEVAGTGKSLEEVNRYVDTLKFTSYRVGDVAETTPAFTDVVLGTFGRDDKGASFTITLTFNPAIFDQSQDIQLVIPQIVTTRSQVESQTTNLFNDTSPGVQ